MIRYVCPIINLQEEYNNTMIKDKSIFFNKRDSLGVGMFLRADLNESIQLRHLAALLPSLFEPV